MTLALIALSLLWPPLPPQRTTFSQPPEMDVLRQLRLVKERMAKESLRTEESFERHHELWGAYRALKWALGIVACPPFNIIVDKRCLPIAAKDARY